jgi:hypothetical protein
MVVFVNGVGGYVGSRSDLRTADSPTCQLPEN